jgi:hypothetical protein
MNKVCLRVSIKFLRVISFGGLYVQAIGFENDHVNNDGEGFHYHHAHAAMVMIFEAKGCVTWCPKRLKDKDHTYISGLMDERIKMSSRCFSSCRQLTARCHSPPPQWERRRPPPPATAVRLLGGKGDGLRRPHEDPRRHHGHRSLGLSSTPELVSRRRCHRCRRVASLFALLLR